MIDLLVFQFDLDTAMIAGACIWSLALYLGLASLRDWITKQLYRWFNFAERSLYTSEEEFERTRQARESQNDFYASLMSIVPFLILGVMSNWLVEISLGRSWAISMGILACMGTGVYELGRRSQSDLN